MQLQKLINIVWHKYNLIISSSVGSGDPDKYLYEILHEHLPEEAPFEKNLTYVK